MAKGDHGGFRALRSGPQALPDSGEEALEDCVRGQIDLGRGSGGCQLPGTTVTHVSP